MKASMQSRFGRGMVFVLCLILAGSTLIVYPPDTYAATTIPVVNDDETTTNWTSSDIGTPAQAGAASYEDGTFTITGSSGDTWGSSDNSHYVYLPQSGNFSVTARVTSLENTAAFTKAGVMIRDSLEPDSKNILTAARGGGGLTNQYRLIDSANTQSKLTDTGDIPVFLKIERYDSYFTSFYSTDGEVWFQWENTKVIAMDSEVYVGIAVVTNKDIVTGDGILSVGTFDHVAISSVVEPPTEDNLRFENLGEAPNLDPDSPNILANPGFEKGLTGWSGDWGNNEVVDSNFHTGLYALQVGTEGGRTQDITAGFTVGNTLTLSGWGKLSESDSGTGEIGVFFKNASGTNIASQFLGFTTNTLTQKSLSYTIPAGTATLQVFVYNSASTALYVDDIALTIASPNLVANPGFEDELTGWTGDWGNNEVVDSNFHTGLYALQVGTEGGRTQDITAGFAVGNTLTLSGWGKLSEPDSGTGEIGVFFKNASGTNIASQFLGFTTNTFTQKSLSYTIPAGTATLQVVVYNSAASALYVDDIVITVPIIQPVQTSIPAFPGAEGFGAGSIGGRGGAVIEVTNLNDSGPGSLRAAMTASGPRTVVFKVGGTITLNSAIKVSGLDKSYLTVAGQTAPGGGIQIKGWGIHLTDVHDIIIRYMKIRPGETGPNDSGADKAGILIEGKGGYEGDPVKPVYNVIIDHCDLEYSPRDNLTTWDYVYNITLQRNIFAKAITHDDSWGGKGALIGMTSTTKPQFNAKNISIHHNLYAHNHQRSPAIRIVGEVEVVNNVIYNWYQFGGQVDNYDGNGGSTTQVNRTNFIGNYYIDGANTLADRYPILYRSLQPEGLYVSDNIGRYRPNSTYPEWSIVGDGNDGIVPYSSVPAPTAYQATTPFAMSSGYPITIQSSSAIVNNILNDVGANRVNVNTLYQDTLTQEIMDDVANGTGSVILGHAPTVTWPTLSAGTAYVDTDNDGMSDAWEMTNFGDLSQSSNGYYFEDDYTNLEHFINGTDNGISLNDNAQLSSLTVDQGALSPDFSASHLNYTLELPYTASSLNFTLTKAEPAQTLTVTGAVNSSVTGNVYTYSVSNLIVGSNAIQIQVTAQDGTTINSYQLTLNRAAQAAAPGGSGDGSTTPTLPTNSVVTSKDGKLTIPAGKTGEVSLGDEVTITIPPGTTDKELKLTIEKVMDAQELYTNKDVLISPIYEILKNFSENFSKPVSLTFSFDPTSLNSNQRASVFYYDEAKKEWVEVGGKVNDDRITAEVDHFTKFAVFAVDLADDVSTMQLSDISGHWAEASIAQAVNDGIVAGYPDGTFKPNHTVTRAEFAVMLMNTLNPIEEGVALAFTDTSKIGTWAQKAIAQAVQAGIIKGYEDGSIRPDAEITRSEMAVMLTRALGLSAEANAATDFADEKDVPAWAISSVAYVKQAGIMQGKGKNKFAPQDHATRAEAVTVLLKILEKNSK